MRSDFTRTVAIVLALLWASATVAQVPTKVLPVVSAASIPLYPPLARAANVQGIVHVKITTDGHQVVRAQAEGGPKLLVTAAEENARTWQFSTHEATTLTVTYHYKLDAKLKDNPNNSTVVLRLPTDVDISTSPMSPLDTVGTSTMPTTH